MKIILFILNSFFIFAGAVNLGFSKFLMAIPMIFFQWRYISRWSTGFKKAGYIVFALAIALIVLRQKPNRFYFPDLKSQVTLSKDICAFRVSSGWMMAHHELDKCVTDESFVFKIFNKGESFIVDSITVSHADMGFQLFLGLKGREHLTVNGKDDNLIREDGSFIKHDEIQRKELFYLSNLMYYPIAPVFFWR